MASVGERLRDPVVWSDASQILKTVAAAVIAWVIARDVLGIAQPFLEAFYARQGTENSGYVTDAFLRDVSRAASVDAGPALGQADSAFATGRLRRADADASRVGVSGTPTLTVRRGNGPERALAASPLDAAAVMAELAREVAR